MVHIYHARVHLDNEIYRNLPRGKNTQFLSERINSIRIHKYNTTIYNRKRNASSEHQTFIKPEIYRVTWSLVQIHL